MADDDIALRVVPAPVPGVSCTAHGNAACWQCSLNPATCLQPGETPGCSTYAVAGMHWDTCPNRVQKVYASHMELTTGQPYTPISEATHHSLLAANRQIREELAKVQTNILPDVRRLVGDARSLEVEKQTVRHLAKVIARMGEQLELARWLYAEAEFHRDRFADDRADRVSALAQARFDLRRYKDLVDELRKQLAAFATGPECRDRTHRGLSAGETERLRRVESAMLVLGAPAFSPRDDPGGPIIRWVQELSKQAQLTPNQVAADLRHVQDQLAKLREVAREGGWTPGLDLVDWFRKRLVEWSALRGVVSDIGADAPADPKWTAGMVIEHYNPDTLACYLAELLKPLPYLDRNNPRTWWSAKVTRVIAGPTNKDGVSMAGVSIGQHVNLAPGKNNRVIPPEEPAGEYCDTCKDTFPKNDHYHCAVCGGRTGMMGHPDGCPNSWATGDLIEYAGIGGWWIAQLTSQLEEPAMWEAEVVASTYVGTPVGDTVQVNEQKPRHRRVAHGVDARPRPTRDEWVAHYNDRFEASLAHGSDKDHADTWACAETTRVLGEEPPE